MTEQDILLKYGTHINLGWCVQVILITDLRYLRIASIEPQLIPAITLKQIKFNLNERGIPTSFITWAYVSESTLQKLRHNPDYLLHFSEWNEGTNVLIMDIVAPFGDLKRLLLEFSLDMKNNFDYDMKRPYTNTQAHIRQPPIVISCELWTIGIIFPIIRDHNYWFYTRLYYAFLFYNFFSLINH